MARRESELVIFCQGRFFSLYELKTAIIKCCQGSLTGFYGQWSEMAVWEVVEAVEIVAEVHKRE